jgi:hypothetical protein
MLAVIWVGLPGLLVAGTVVWATRPYGGGAAPGSIRRARVGRIAGLVAGAVGGVVVVWRSRVWLGPIAIVLGTLAGVLLAELVGRERPSGPMRSASLEPRFVRHYVPGWAWSVAIAAGAATVLGTMVLAVAPVLHYGPWHPVPGDTALLLPGGALPWPALGLSVPLAVIAVATLAVGGFLARRALAIPDTNDGPDTDVTPSPAALRRRNVVGAVTGAVVGVELLALGALTILTGDGLVIPGSSGGAVALTSRVLLWVGMAIVVAAVVASCHLGRWHRGLRTTGLKALGKPDDQSRAATPSSW